MAKLDAMSRHDFGSDLSASVLAGWLLVVGFEGTTLPESVCAALRKGDRAGVILFRRNLPDVETTRALTLSVQSAAPPSAPPLLVGIDEEGGRVSRLPAPETKLPPARLFGTAGDPELVRDGGAAIGARLFTLGFNWNFAPVLDVDSNPKNPVIGDRAFSADPNQVAALGLAFAAGLERAGMLACGKHFPGHGDTDTDSHLALPRLSHDRARLEAIELVPFRAAARAKLESLMTAHVVLTAFDDALPATLSRRVMTELLRHDLGYEGTLVSDDLEMRAVADRFRVEEAAVLAIAAGCDLLLVCKSVERAELAHAALTREIESSPAFRACALAAGRRVDALRKLAASRRARALASADTPPTVADMNRRVLAAAGGELASGVDPTERDAPARGGSS